MPRSSYWKLLKDVRIERWIIATNDVGVKEYLKMYSSPQTFSNALSPVQVAVAAAALDIVKSGEGACRREKLLSNSLHLRSRLAANNFSCLGEPSAIVPVFLGDDGSARNLWRLLSNKGVASNFVEFPAVANNRARIRSMSRAIIATNMRINS